MTTWNKKVQVQHLLNIFHKSICDLADFHWLCFSGCGGRAEYNVLQELKVTNKNWSFWLKCTYGDQIVI